MNERQVSVPIRGRGADTATFVLVHGGWHGGWCWRHVAPLLRVAGHAVYAPTLTGLGERAHLLDPAVDLDTHVRDVVEFLEGEICARLSWWATATAGWSSPGRRT
jgi:alpha-beta hydrolase superfamily lysophospholipase